MGKRDVASGMKAMGVDTWTKWELFGLLGSKGTAMVSMAGVPSVVQAVGREDGSGSSFNVVVHVPGQGTKTVYVRTVD